MTSKANYQQDLWPDDIASVTVISPKTIVEEQGKILGQRTNNLIVGELKMGDYLSESSSSRFFYNFYLYCSSLNYRYKLFELSFNLAENYPAYIVADSIILEENSVDFPKTENINEVVATSEERFIEILRKIFSSSKTRKVITGILAQLQ